MSFEVQMSTLCDGWVNCWSDDTETPITFTTASEAEAAISEHLADVAEAVRCGDMGAEYSRDDYRVVEVGGFALTAPEPLPAVAPAIPKTDARWLPYNGPWPRKRHYHRCPQCTNGVNCYKQRCSKPVLMSNVCGWCRPFTPGLYTK